MLDNNNPTSLIDIMAQLLMELNFSEELKDAGYSEGEFNKNPNSEVANKVMRLYNESLYTVSIPKHLRRHRDDIEDIFADNFAESLESKIKARTGENNVSSEMLNKVKEIESSLQNSFLLKGYLLDTIKEEKNYDEEILNNVFGFSSDSLLYPLIEDKDYGQNAADSLYASSESTKFLESGNDYSAIQMNEGPGRGAQQYEMNVFTGGLNENTQGGAETAVRRMRNAYIDQNLEMSKAWEDTLNISELDNPSYNIDFSKLEPALQNELFYSDKQQNPNLSLMKLGSGETTIKDAWLDTHWAGWQKQENPEQARQEKSEWYDERIGDFKRKEDIDNLLDLYYTPQKVQLKKIINDQIQGNR